MPLFHFSAEERAALESLILPIAFYQFTGNQIEVLLTSDGFLELFSYKNREDAASRINFDIFHNIHPDDVTKFASGSFRFLSGEDNELDLVFRNKKSGGPEYHIVHAVGRHLDKGEGIRISQIWFMDEGSYLEGAVEYSSGVNKGLSHALREQTLFRTSEYDQLTGLPRMTYFFELAAEGKSEIERLGGDPVLLFFDLSGMKFFNARYGFTEGDRLLQAFAQMLSYTFKNECSCHISGDHFLAFSEADGLEEKLDQFLTACQTLNGGNNLPVQIGIYKASVENVPVSVACDRAKLACDGLRNTFKSGYEYYNQDLRIEAERRQYILTNLDRAIENGWIQVYYQPIVRAVTGRASDEEALARWIDPERGFLSPAEFIPFLEDAKLIYKLDLCILEQVLKKIKLQKEAGIYVVPQSINLSRSDFDACDIVEEICRRVDEAGVGRDLITIEITESVIGSDIDFMKHQVERFHDLGFSVWMDDFGSGYSSIDVLQSIQFDLIKFDMSFMKKLDEGDSGKVILTELMKMVISLGIDTVCEGVETQEQVCFLRESGCLKLQGYFFEKPTPLDKIMERYERGCQVGNENPAEAGYYEAIGRVNLFDLGTIASEDDRAIQNFSNTIPMAIIELRDGNMHLVRSNHSYRDFVGRFNGDRNCQDPFENDVTFRVSETFEKHLLRCCKSDSLTLFDEQMLDGAQVHYIIRKIAVNPLSGTTAIAVAVLSIVDSDAGTTYANIARALAADYYNIYYVDLDTDLFIEYSSPVGGEDLAKERHGEHFFDTARRDAMIRIYAEDRKPFLEIFTKENILKELDEQGVFATTYRLIDTGTPMYVNMKIMRMQPDPKHLIIGISLVDSQMKQHELAEKIQREETAYARIMALTGGYLSLYTVDPETNRYYEYIATNEYASLGFAKSGEDFFLRGIEDGIQVVYEEDLPKYLAGFSKDQVLKEIHKKGSYELQYRLKLSSGPCPVTLRIVSVRERDGEKLIAGVKA